MSTHDLALMALKRALRLALITSLLAALLATLAVSFTARAEEYRYGIEAGDIGTIVAGSPRRAEAYEAVVDRCVAKRVALYVAQRGQEPNVDRYEDFLLDCANATVRK